MSKQEKEEIKWIAKVTVKSMGFTDTMIRDFLPPPKLVPNPHYKCAGEMMLWDENTVKSIMQTERVQEALRKAEKRRAAVQNAKEKSRQEIKNLFDLYDITNMIDRSKSLHRSFVLHVGPTNSGKTHDALEVLRAGESGVYLGPLRLLAMEVADRLNGSECPCTLLTGEEMREEIGATHIASTIEMLSPEAHYVVGVIDEAQMLTDPERGFAWTKAILLLNADEIHICMAPEAEKAVVDLLHTCEAPFRIVRHERLTTLTAIPYQQELKTGLPCTEKGDALIVFSRRNVLALSSELKKAGKTVSVIYGALPPLSRREEARRFNSGETDLLVATDAIGMGLNLPIRRVQFVETTKFDGCQTRSLYKQEYKQIGGRAGRYGVYNSGTVCARGVNAAKLQTMLDTPSACISKIVVPFPDNVVESKYPLEKLFEYWNRMPTKEGFVRQDITNMQRLLALIPKGRTDKKQFVFSAIQCPVNFNDDNQVYFWLRCFDSAYEEKPLAKPYIDLSTLENAEASSHLLDIYHQMMRKIGIEVDLSSERQNICDAINVFLIKGYHGKRCSICKTELPPLYPYGMCEKCHQLYY